MTDVQAQYLLIEEALQDGIQFMAEYGDDFQESDFQNWHWNWKDVLVPALVANLYDPEETYERQWLIVSVIGISDNEDLWETLWLAYTEGDEYIEMLAQWAMLNINKHRYIVEDFFTAMAHFVYWKFQVGLDEFFAALAAFAKDQVDAELIQGGYQLMLF